MLIDEREKRYYTKMKKQDQRVMEAQGKLSNSPPTVQEIFFSKT